MSLGDGARESADSTERHHAVGVGRAARPPRVRSSRSWRAARNEWPWAVLFVAPLCFGVFVFYIWPILQTFWFSFTTWSAFGDVTFSGTDNYRSLIVDADFYRALLNTAIYTAIVLLGVPIAVWVASLINTPGLKFAQLYRVLFFCPISRCRRRWRWCGE